MTPFDVSDGVVLLSVPTVAEIDTITDLCQDPEIRRWTEIPVPYGRADAETFVTESVVTGWADDTTMTWGVRTAHDGRLQGMVGIDVVDDGEIGFWMGPQGRGRGWTTRAARLAVAAAFERGVDHVRWKAFVGNDASRRVALAIGFRTDGTIRRAINQRGVWRDAWVATLLPDELR